MDDPALLTLAESLGLAAYECAPTGAVARAGPRLAALAGRPLAEVLAAPLEALCAPDDRDRVRAARAAASPGGPPLDLVYRLRPTSGPDIPVRDVAVVRGGAGTPLLAGAIEDLRPRRLEEEAARAAGMADLAAGVAHEVNNALSGVLNYAQLARRCAPGDPHVSEALDGVVEEGRRILEMTRALLTFARRGEGALPPADLLRAALAPVRRELRDELIGVELEVPADIPPLRARGDELQRALLHAIGFARRAVGSRAAARERSSLALRARCELDPEPGWVVLEVAVEPPPSRPLDDEEAAWARERCRALVEAQGGRVELEPGVTRLRLPMA
ncbi:MAG: hypothetical protein M9894_31030 [Planctomycetes bacterium]|nr:hypothetical protein [Planctomycetota bacterium]